MKVRLKQALSIGLLATMIFPPAFALGAETERAAATSEKSQPGSVQVTAAASATPDKSAYGEVDARMVRIERRLVEDLATGRLTPLQAQELHDALDHIAELEAQFRAKSAKVTHWQMVRLHTLLDNLSDAISKSESDRDLASVDLQFSKEDLSHRIDLASRQGRLTPQEVADLKQRFNRILSLETMFLKTQGKLRYHEKLSLCIDLDHLGQRLDSYLSKSPLALPDTKGEGDKIRARIDEAVKSGKLNDGKASEYKKKLADLHADIDSATRKGSTLSDEQVIAIGLALDEIANQVEALFEDLALASAIEQRLVRLDKKMALALEEGELNPIETLELNEDLEAIRAAREKMLAEGNLKEDGLAGLALDLARLEGRVDRQVHGPTRLWSGLTVEIAHLSHRLAEGTKAERISKEDAKAIRTALVEINKNKFNFKKDDPKLSLSSQALTLAEDLQRLVARLDRTMKDRQMDMPNIDNLKQAIDQRIADYTVSGDLSLGDSRTAVLALAEINSTKEKYTSSENELDAREKFALAYELERVAVDVEERIHGREALFPGLDRRRAQIEELINEGLSSGRLDSSSAEFYRTQLADSSKLEKQYRADSIGLTGDKALELVVALEKIWLQLDRALREKQVMISDLVSMEGNVEKKIRQGFANGYLSPAEADGLRMSYDRLVEAFNRMRSGEGGLSYGEKLAFAYGFERLNAYVERNHRHAPVELPSIEAHRKETEQKIASLLATGRLSLQEAQDLKSLLDEVGKTAAEKHASGGGMSYQEFLIVAVDLNRIRRRVEQRAAAQEKRLPDIDAVQSELDKKIENAKAAGKLKAADYQSLKSVMDQIAEKEAAYRISDEALSYAEVIDLVLSLQKVKEKLEGGMQPSKPADNKTKPDSGKSKATDSAKTKPAARTSEKKTVASKKSAGSKKESASKPVSGTESKAESKEKKN